MKLLVKGNAKLDKGVATWNIPASKEVCGRVCEGCYAVKEQERWKSVRVGRDRRLEASKRADFVDNMSAEIAKHKGKYIRVHSSGEFYSQEYIDKWAKIAEKNPDKIFYAYTKRGDFNFSKVLALPNFVLHNSYVKTVSGMKVNYGSPEYVAELAKETGGFICPLATDRTGQCGSTCTWCMDKANEGTPILFEQH